MEGLRREKDTLTPFSHAMSAQIRPEQSIVPIVRATRERPLMKVLGTGFFVGNQSVLHLITAKHVIANNPLGDNEKYGIVFRESKSIKIIASLHVDASVDFDLAACVVSRSDFPDAVPLGIGRADPTLNADILSYEYSSTRIERTHTGGTNVSVEPYAHKGHIVRLFDSTYPEKVRTPSYLISFPALQGASGAPLITATSSKKSFAVVGMIVANVERHLLPAQIVQIQDGESYCETTSYFLPYGKALARPILAKCLDEMDIPFFYSEDTERWWQRALNWRSS